MRCTLCTGSPPGIHAELPTNLETYTTIAVQHMTTYWAILEKMRGSKLRLTKIDDEIYDHFKKDFPEFDTKATINEDEMKSKEGKERWRNFIMAYEKRIDDYNFGTMLRANPKFEYGEKETIFGMALLLRNGRTMTLIPSLRHSYENAVLRCGDCKVGEYPP